MRYRADNVDDLEFIERFYADIEQGFKSIGKEYVRPADYIERAIRIMNNSTKRPKLLFQTEGRKTNGVML